MRLVALLATVLVTFSSTPVLQSQSQAATPGQRGASKRPADSAMEFLLRSAATDFHAHPVPVVRRFRRIRFGHIVIPTGARQYQLCGDLLPRRLEGKVEWTPFATIKTFDYEQYVGAEAVSWCQRSRFIQDTNEDLSSKLDKLLNSVR